MEILHWYAVWASVSPKCQWNKFTSLRGQQDQVKKNNTRIAILFTSPQNGRGTGSFHLSSSSSSVVIYNFRLQCHSFLLCTLPDALVDILGKCPLWCWQSSKIRKDKMLKGPASVRGAADQLLSRIASNVDNLKTLGRYSTKSTKDWKTDLFGPTFEM